MDGETCACGHVLDEHIETKVGPCTIEGCPCVYFEADPDADEG